MVAIILSTISIVISIIFGLISLVIITSVLNSKESKDTIIHNNIPLDNNNENDFERGYDTARSNFIRLIHLTLFDMYNKCEIIDYDEQISTLMERMTEILNDDEYLSELDKKLNQYIEDNNDTNSY